ncbi:MAG: hypothetical protein Q4G27_06400 [Flavobacteriaceae bacterium]|nr:hypothetical protein [Flavobacteriaceae bacterium]
MSNKKLADIIKKLGFLFPETEEEINEFEANHEINDDSIYCYDNPDNIIKNGYRKVVKIENVNYSSEELQNLSMAARDGKEISDEVKKKMKKDKDNARKK